MSLGAEDEGPFLMNLLHFRRTFVEKMFAIHAKVTACQNSGNVLGKDARHYYDLYCLAAEPEVLAMLKSEEYQAIKTDYDRIASQHFPNSYHVPLNMQFCNSQALFPAPEMTAMLSKEFEAQCKLLCFADYPTWNELRARFDSIRELI
jgi:hypothetical protein